MPNAGRVVEGIDLGQFGHPTLAEFRGIPYALPPTGALRWQPPVANPGWAGDDDDDGTPTTFKATEYGNSCMQPRLIPLSPGAKIHENCLYLNVVSPKSALQSGAGNNNKLPVMVWIHGGAYMLGSGDEVDIRRAALVSSSEDGIVMVSMNYRLGAFGFLGGSDIMERTNGNGAGNFAIQDQRLALAWVKDNIGFFGGDRDSVTIFGQSSGGASVIHHLTQPASFPLYHKAIVQSGAYNLGAVTMAHAEDAYAKFLTVSGCESLDCLVEKGENEILAYSNTVGEMMNEGRQSPALISNSDWVPVIDGINLPNSPSALIATKKHNVNVPVIIGSTREDLQKPGSWDLPQNMTEAEFDNRLETYLYLNDDEVAEIKSIYDPENYTYPSNLGDYSIWYWMFIRFLIDRIVAHGACSVRWIARLLDEGGGPAVYSYLFAPTGFLGQIFVNHGDDIASCFGPDAMDEIAADILGLDPIVIPAEYKELVVSHSAYWLNFAKNGDPNIAGDASTEPAAFWPKFTASEDKILRLDVASFGGIQTVEGLRKAACDWHTGYAMAQGVLESPGGGMSPFVDGLPASNDLAGSSPANEEGRDSRSSADSCHVRPLLGLLMSLSSALVALIF